MQSDGRSWDDIRPVRMTPAFVDHPEGIRPLLSISWQVIAR
jgi:ribonuclease PH